MSDPLLNYLEVYSALHAGKKVLWRVKGDDTSDAWTTITKEHFIEFTADSAMQRFEYRLAENPVPSHGKPALGLVPRWLYIENRIFDLCAAIGRYRDTNQPIPPEWYQELGELATWYYQNSLPK